jgi:hypothetical protein
VLSVCSVYLHTILRVNAALDASPLPPPNTQLHCRFRGAPPRGTRRTLGTLGVQPLFKAHPVQFIRSVPAGGSAPPAVSPDVLVSWELDTVFSAKKPLQTCATARSQSPNSQPRRCRCQLAAAAGSRVGRAFVCLFARWILTQDGSVLGVDSIQKDTCTQLVAVDRHVASTGRSLLGLHNAAASPSCTREPRFPAAARIGLRRRCALRGTAGDVPLRCGRVSAAVRCTAETGR